MIYEKLIEWKEMKQYFLGTKLIIIIIMISCVLCSIYLWLEDLQCAFLH